MKSVKAKIILFMVIVIFIACSTCTMAGIITSQKHLMSAQQEQLISEAERYSSQINAWMAREIELVSNVAITLGDIENLADYDIETDLHRFANDRNEILTLYFGLDSNGAFYQTSDDELPPGYDPRTRDWYTGSREKKGVVITEPYLDPMSFVMCTTIGAPVYDRENKFVGAVAIDISLDTITQLTASASYADGVYGFIIDSAGNYVYHPNTDYMPTEDTLISVVDTIPVIKDTYNNTSGVISKYTDYKGVDVYITTSLIGDTGYVLGMALPVANTEVAGRRIGINCLVVEVIVIVFAVLGAASLIGMFLKPLKRIRILMDSLSNGQLTDTYEKTVRKDDIGLLENTMIDTYNYLAKMINEANQILHEMSAKNLATDDMTAYPGEFEKLSKSINDVKHILNELVGTMQIAANEVHLGTSQLTEAADALAQSTTQEAMSVETLQNNLENIDKLIGSNNENCELVGKQLDELNTKIDNSNSEMLKLKDAVDEVKNISEDIQAIVSSIDNIAFQTNILALNAAVEAARAGEAGRGFAVVAEEVRTLATKCAEESNKTSELIMATVKAVNGAKEYTDNTTDYLKDVVVNAGQIAGAFGDIAASSNMQAESSKEIVNEMGNIADAIQSNTATAQETAASCEELSDQAKNLMEMISQFKL